MEGSTFTIEQYLNGKVRNINVPDDAISSILLDSGCSTVDVQISSFNPQTGQTDVQTYTEDVTKDTDVSLLSERQRELCLAWLYVWIAGSPMQSGGYSEQDADWQSSESGERMSAGVLKNYLAMANKIFEKYGLDTISTSKWGFVGHGFRLIRRYH